MRVTIQNDIKYIIDLTSKEAGILKSIIQNPPTDLPEYDRRFLEELFNSLKWQINTVTE